jgi:hypothetical protein
MRSSEPKFTDVAIPSVDADPHLEGLLETAGAPFLLQFDHLLLHGDSHPHAGAHPRRRPWRRAAMPISPQRRTLGDLAVRRAVRVDRR